jgi:hypothetical protein
MKTLFTLISVCVVVPLVLFWGCTVPEEPALPETVDPTATIGSVTRYVATEAIPVRGIGIVAGLAGTGSSECPPNIRQELEKYIWQQVPQAGSVNPRAVIDSQDTAVVEITGVIPAYATTSDVFDVQLRPLSSTQTTSLDGGSLYTSQLKEMSRLTTVEQFTRFSKTLAVAEGPVYSLKAESDAQNNWYVLGGGRALQDSQIKIILNNPNFVTANAIRNRINERFGPKTAVPISTAEINVVFPARDQEQKQRFIRMVESLLIGESPALRDDYTQTLIGQLLAKENPEDAEIALEAIGKPALDELAGLLEHPDPAIRFYAARCMLNIGDARPLAYLRTVINDNASPYRLEAVNAVGLNAKHRDALSILTPVLSDWDVQMRLAAYQMLVRLNSPAISRKVVANGAFVVDSVVCPGPKMVYAYRRKSPRIVVFGSPVHCKENLFIQSDDGSITLNAQAGDKYISVSRKHPNRPRVIGPLSSSYELSILIQTLGDLPEVNARSSSRRPGLALPYSDITSILEKMAGQGAILARFLEGPGPETALVLQDSTSK